MIDPSLSHSTGDNYFPRAKAQQGRENLSLKKTYIIVHSLVDLFWISSNLMCSALEEKVKGQHKLCIWDKKKELFLQAVELKESWARTVLQDHAAAMPPADKDCFVLLSPPSAWQSRSKKGEVARAVVWTDVQGSQFRVVQDEWEEHNENKKAEKGGEISLIFETLTYRLLKVTDLDRQCQVSLPPTFQSHVVDKTVGFFRHCLCS